MSVVLAVGCDCASNQHCCLQVMLPRETRSRWSRAEGNGMTSWGWACVLVVTTMRACVYACASIMNKQLSVCGTAYIGLVYILFDVCSYMVLNAVTAVMLVLAISALTHQPSTSSTHPSPYLPSHTPPHLTSHSPSPIEEGLPTITTIHPPSCLTCDMRMNATLHSVRVH